MTRWRDAGGALLPSIQRWIRARACGAPGTSQFETTEVLRATEQADGSVELDIRYVFERDGFSQYDQTETYVGHLVLDADLAVIGGALSRELP